MGLTSEAQKYCNDKQCWLPKSLGTTLMIRTNVSKLADSKSKRMIENSMALLSNDKNVPVSYITKIDVFNMNHKRSEFDVLETMSLFEIEKGLCIKMMPSGFAVSDKFKKDCK